MSTTVIDVQLFRRMFLRGAQNLEANKAWINELNVFPVPDGDTGTNMSMTIVSAVHEVVNVDDENDMKKLCKAISSGSLRGARGNSGVILSQLLRGFCKVARTNGELDVPGFAEALEKAVETAYKAVMKPKEGTILTVARLSAEKARELADEGVTEFEEFLPQVIEASEAALEMTPDLLPVLKQAGVVDSGGQGFVQILKGFWEGFQGEETDVDALLNPKKPAAPEEEASPDENAEPSEEEKEKERLANLKFGYVISFLDTFTKPYNDKIDRDVTSYMQSIADEIVKIRDDAYMRVQMKTNDPGLVMQRALLYGQLTEISIANLRQGEPYEVLEDPAAQILTSQDQPDETIADGEIISPQGTSGTDGMEQEDSAESAGSPEKEENSGTVSGLYTPLEEQEHKELGMIAVAAGDGLAEIFRGLGVDYVISGGQTMNPSTEDILTAVDHVNADTIFVMPNNKNIVMAANQAASISTEKKLIVIPTTNIPQGITAAINFIPDQGTAANEEAMKEEILRVHSAEVTYAVRDTVIDNIEIHQGNMMCIGDGGLLCVGEDRNETTLEGIAKLADETTELISVYYGSDTTDEQAQELYAKITERFPGIDVELQSGGQPVYYYIISAE